MTPPTRHAVIVGLGFGDEGKGATVDYLARQAHYRDVVRYNGGSQAAHHVMRAEDGHVHCFTQVGSAAMNPGCRTFLSKHVVVEPLGLEKELDTLAKAGVFAHGAQHIDTRATLTTPYHRALNRIRECARGVRARHGSCGKGVGVAHLDRTLDRAPCVLVEDVLGGESHLTHKLEQVRLTMLDRAEQALPREQHESSERLATEFSHLRDRSLSSWLARQYTRILVEEMIVLDRDGELLSEVLRSRAVLFEGAQGVGLDPDHGFFPHVTATRTTPHQAWELIDEAHSAIDVWTLGICRAYATRHGAGPFPGEDLELTRRLPEAHNDHGPWQGAWRAGWFDEVWMRHALARACEGRVDALAVTCVDRLEELDKLEIITAYDGDPNPDWLAHISTQWQTHLPDMTLATRDCTGWKVNDYLDTIQDALGTPIHHTSHGPTALDRRPYSG